MVKHCLTIYDECNDAWERVRKHSFILIHLKQNAEK